MRRWGDLVAGEGIWFPVASLVYKCNASFPAVVSSLLKVPRVRPSPWDSVAWSCGLHVLRKPSKLDDGTLSQDMRHLCIHGPLIIHKTEDHSGIKYDRKLGRVNGTNMHLQRTNQNFVAPTYSHAYNFILDRWSQQRFFVRQVPSSLTSVHMYGVILN